MEPPFSNQVKNANSDDSGKNSQPNGKESNFNSIQIPQISLPKGGGAIRGIGEKFSVNAITGTGSMSVPIFTSPGRSDFSPKISLSYNSGSGNGPFGIGWRLSVPSVTRKTDKGLPRYDDGHDSDVFLISDAEDLVPMLTNQGGIWKPISLPYTSPGGISYNISRYRPRIEGLFARIERWKRQSDGDMHWRVTTKDNMVSIYGQSASARISDPSDPSRVFQWLLEATYDDKGNVMSYVYKPEDNIGRDPFAANERNRIKGNALFTNTYLKRILYGNRLPHVTGEDLSARKDWLFEVVLDYGEHNLLNPAPAPDPSLQWVTRADPFSEFRSTFEVRTYRLCQRVLMFHHFPDPVRGQTGYNGLVRSTDVSYDQENPVSTLMGNRIATRLLSVKQTGYIWDAVNNVYITKSFPPVEYGYSDIVIDPTIYSVDPASLENAPAGLAGKGYQLMDLDGEGSGGILYADGGSLYYKRNSSPANTTLTKGVERATPLFKPQELIPTQPGLLLNGRQPQFMDLTADGHQDMVQMEGAVRGFYRHADDETWEGFRAFNQFPGSVDTRDQNVKFIDIDGDGLADILMSEDEVLSWHRSLGEHGFGEREYARKPFDEEMGPALIFADPTQCIFLSDMSGDGLTDILRIRNGEVCYWPNKGYGLFGAKVTMDNAPCFEANDVFDQQRVRLADIDGSGTTDIVYLRGDGIVLYFNQSGNAFADEMLLGSVPAVDNLASITVVDLLGNGLACLVWSSTLTADAGSPMKYIDLMGGQKAHLLMVVKNNLGAETRIRYASSTKFYVQDRDAETPWVTRLAFPVYVVERLEVFDFIGRTRLVTSYSYRHGYFDGIEREFRGFGYVEQQDAESFGDSASLFTEDTDTEADALHAPPVVTKTWYHTGAWPDEDTLLFHMSDDYYKAPGAAGVNFLPDTILPVDIFLPDGSRLLYTLTGEEAREAARAFKGSILRQEVYAYDGGGKAAIPYSISERNYTVECFQPQGDNIYAVFFTHARETINFQLERNPKDPRVAHNVVLRVDPFGDVLSGVSAVYARNIVQAGIAMTPIVAPGTAPDVNVDPSQFAQPEQIQPLFTTTENSFTPAIDNLASAYRGPMASEVFTYELTRPARADETIIYAFADLMTLVITAIVIPFETVPDLSKIQKRLIADAQTLYLKNDLTALPFGQNDSLGLVYKTFKLAMTEVLAEQIFITGNSNPNKPANAAALDAILSGSGAYVNNAASKDWWIPSGQILYSPVPAVPAIPFVQDATYAAKHFYLQQGNLDPFGQYGRMVYDPFDLLLQQTLDALGNTTLAINDYRVLAAATTTDPNGNQTSAAFDPLNMVCGTAVQGKPVAAGTESGDTLVNFVVNLDQPTIDAFYNTPDPGVPALGLLGTATTRIIYDLQSFINSVSANPGDPTHWLPVFAATIARETHTSDILKGGQTKVQVSFSYTDGMSREIQRKIQAEPALGVNPRWAGTGWRIFNNKGKAVRQYEPFFSATHHYEFANKTGVTPTIFYDPLQRAVATLHSDHSWEKLVFNPWLQMTWDENDTVLLNPKTDLDVGSLFSLLPDADYLPTWYGVNSGGGALPLQQDAAAKASVHAGTPAAVFFDAMGRPFLTVAHNRYQNGAINVDQYYSTRTQLDIQGNKLSMSDALGRIFNRYDYALTKQWIHYSSMEAGERLSLSDVGSKPIREWNSRGFLRVYGYDELQRQIGLTVSGVGLLNVLSEKIVYGDSKVGGPLNPEQNNQRNRKYQSFDNSGIVAFLNYDFKGNLIRQSRQLLKGNVYKSTVDWNQVQTPDEIFTSAGRFDALNRVLQQVTPYSNQPGTKLNVLQPSYNKAGLLETIDVWQQQNAEPAGVLDNTTATLYAVKNISYNAKGQRMEIDYGMSGAVQVNTTYQYDTETFRLVNQTSTRMNDGILLQDLQYYYDPVGNITHTQDDADIQNVVYFRNKRVEPSADYVYDAVYNLLKAKGREHLGQIPSYNDWSNINLPHPNDGNAMGVYIENFGYDPVGNILKIQHVDSDPVNPGWTRIFHYNEVSGIEAARQNNRLTSTDIGGLTETYSVAGNGYDPNGNMLDMPQLQVMQWDFKDELQMTQRQSVNNADTDGVQHNGEKTYYTYDSSGERIRKVTESPAGLIIKQRIYLGSVEVYREYDNTGAVVLERDTMHVMDGKRRSAILETLATGKDGSPVQLNRYQFDNIIDSACLEIDDTGNIISYEEYYPFGSTSYQGVNQAIRAAAKRYRYIGKERDEETGLGCHGARYYAPWLCRWVACDPAGPVDGPNLYRYARNNPIRLLDSNGMDPIPTDISDLPERADDDPPPDPTGAQSQNGNFSATAATQDENFQTSEFTLTGFGSGNRPGQPSNPNGGATFLYHYRNVVSKGVEVGLQLGGGGSGPPASGSGLVNFTLHLGQSADTDSDAAKDPKKINQTISGVGFVFGFLWGQNPTNPGVSPDDPPESVGGANPAGSAQYALSALHFKKQGKTEPHLHLDREFDFNVGLAAARFGLINGVSVAGLVQISAIINETIEVSQDKGVSLNFEIGGTANLGAAGVVPGGSSGMPVYGSGANGLPASVSLFAGIGVTVAWGDYSVTFEPYATHEAAPNVATLGSTGHFEDGAWGGGLRIDLTAIGRPKTSHFP